MTVREYNDCELMDEHVTTACVVHVTFTGQLTHWPPSTCVVILQAYAA